MWLFEQKCFITFLNSQMHEFHIDVRKSGEKTENQLVMA